MKQQILNSLAQQIQIVEIIKKVRNDTRLSEEDHKVLLEEFAKELRSFRSKQDKIKRITEMIKDDHRSFLIRAYEGIVTYSEQLHEEGDRIEIAVNELISLNEWRFNHDLIGRNFKEREAVVRNYIQNKNKLLDKYWRLISDDNKQICLASVDVEGFDLSELNLSRVNFGHTSLHGVNLLNTAVCLEQISYVPSVKEIKMDGDLKEELMSFRYDFIIRSISERSQIIIEARKFIDSLLLLYKLCGYPAEFQDNPLRVINDRMTEISDEVLKHVVFMVVTSQHINKLPLSHKHNFITVSSNRDLVFESNRTTLLSILDEVLATRGYTLPAEIVAYVIHIKLYHLYNTIGDISLFIDDLKEKIEEFDGERVSILKRELAALKVQRKKALYDQEQVQFKYDAKSIEVHLSNLNGDKGFDTELNPTDRLTTVFNIARENGCTVDLSGLDLTKVDFKMIDMSGIVVILSPDQEQGILTESAVQQRYKVFFKAAIEGDANKLTKLLDLGFYIDMRDEAGRTALMHACINGHVQAARFLLEKGASINEKTNSGWKIIEGVCRDSAARKDIVELLIDHGAVLDAHSAAAFGDATKVISFDDAELEVLVAGESVLHTAIKHNRLEIVRLLKERVAIKQPNDNGWNALHLACDEGNEEIVRSLVSEFDLETTTGVQARAQFYFAKYFKIAMQKGYFNIARVIARTGVIDLEDLRQVKEVVRKSSDTVLRLLKEKGISLGEQSDRAWNALETACENGDVEAVEYLINDYQLVKDRQKPGQTAMEIATRKNDLAIMRILKESGAVLTLESAIALKEDEAFKLLEADPIEAFHLACRYNWPLLVEKLIKYSNTKLQSKSGLELACEVGHTDIVEVLIKHKVDLGSSLYRAIVNARANIVKMLLENNVSPDLEWMGRPVLLHAIDRCNKGGKEIVKLLLQYGADVACKDLEGNTVPHYLAENDVEDLLDLVIDGFKTKKNKLGKTAKDLRKSSQTIVDPQVSWHAKDDEVITKFAATLLDMGMEIFNVPSDGNCFFYAVADQLKVINGERIMTYDELRKFAINYIREHQSDFTGFLIDETVEGYLDRMSQDREWADHSIIEALSQELRIKIIIIGNNDSRTEIGSEFEEVLYIGHIVELHYVSIHHTEFPPAPIPTEEYFEPNQLHVSLFESQEPVGIGFTNCSQYEEVI